MSQFQSHSRGKVAAAVLFERLWDELVGLISTPATAALLRRAIKRACARTPDLAAPIVTREALEYSYTVPESWKDPARHEAVEQLRRLVRQDLHPLFRELTGPVIARRLAQVPELVDAGIAGEEEDA
jgi:hypothetical protein